MLNYSTPVNQNKTNLLSVTDPILNFTSSSNSKGLFDHRTNTRAHPGRGGSPRG